jgi:hypothetical protein
LFLRRFGVLPYGKSSAEQLAELRFMDAALQDRKLVSLEAE